MAQSQDVVAECPTCKAVVPLDATECPQCGELFDQEVATGGLGSANVTETDQSSDKDGTEEPKTGFREKFLFYTGIFLILSLRFSRPSDVEKDLDALRES